MIDYMKDARSGRIFRVGNGSPQGLYKEMRGVLYLDIGSATFQVKRNSWYGPFIMIGNGSPQNVRTERPGTFYLDMASNPFGAANRLYVNETGLINGWSTTDAELYVNINGSIHGWVEIS